MLAIFPLERKDIRGEWKRVCVFRKGILGYQKWLATCKICLSSTRHHCVRYFSQEYINLGLLSCGLSISLHTVQSSDWHDSALHRWNLQGSSIRVLKGWEKLGASTGEMATCSGGQWAGPGFGRKKDVCGFLEERLGQALGYHLRKGIFAP